MMGLEWLGRSRGVRFWGKLRFVELGRVVVAGFGVSPTRWRIGKGVTTFGVFDKVVPYSVLATSNGLTPSPAIRPQSPRFAPQFLTKNGVDLSQENPINDVCEDLMKI